MIRIRILSYFVWSGALRWSGSSYRVDGVRIVNPDRPIPNRQSLKLFRKRAQNTSNRNK